MEEAALRRQAFTPGEPIARRGLRVNLANDQRLYLAGPGDRFAGISLHQTKSDFPLADQSIVVDIHPDVCRGLPPVVMIAAKAFPKGVTLYGADKGLVSDEPSGFSIGEARSASTGPGSEIEIVPAGATRLEAGGYPPTTSGPAPLRSPAPAANRPIAQTSPAGTSVASSAELSRAANAPAFSGVGNMAAYQKGKSVQDMSPEEARAELNRLTIADWNDGIKGIREKAESAGRPMTRGQAAAVLAKQNSALHEKYLIATNPPNAHQKIRQMFNE